MKTPWVSSSSVLSWMYWSAGKGLEQLIGAFRWVITPGRSCYLNYRSRRISVKRTIPYFENTEDVSCDTK